MALANTVTAEAFLGQWMDSMGHNVLVVHVGEDKPTLLKAILTKPGGGKPKELMIKLDASQQRWRCGNGVLDVDQLTSNNDSKAQPSSVVWVNQNFQVSTWTREKSWSDVAKALKTDLVVALKTADSTVDSPKADTKKTDSPKVNASDAQATEPCATTEMKDSNGLVAAVFLGHWKDSLGNDVNVACDGGTSQGLLKATRTKPDGTKEPKEWLITIDNRIGHWRCGNGALDDHIEYDHNNQPFILSWTTRTWNPYTRTQNERVSTWTREVDHSSTEEGSEDNLKESWANITEDWEGAGDMDAFKRKIMAPIIGVDEPPSKHEQPKATRRSRGKKDAEWAGANDSWSGNNWSGSNNPWKQVADEKAQRASGGAGSNTSKWKEVSAWKRENGRGGRHQQKAASQY